MKSYHATAIFFTCLFASLFGGIILLNGFQGIFQGWSRYTIGVGISLLGIDGMYAIFKMATTKKV